MNPKNCFAVRMEWVNGLLVFLNVARTYELSYADFQCHLLVHALDFQNLKVSKNFATPYLKFTC